MNKSVDDPTIDENGAGAEMGEEAPAGDAVAKVAELEQSLQGCVQMLAELKELVGGEAEEEETPVEPSAPAGGGKAAYGKQKRGGSLADLMGA
jgi:hypothetical protein